MPRVQRDVSNQRPSGPLLILVLGYGCVRDLREGRIYLRRNARSSQGPALEARGELPTWLPATRERAGTSQFVSDSLVYVGTHLISYYYIYTFDSQVSRALKYMLVLIWVAVLTLCVAEEQGWHHQEGLPSDGWPSHRVGADAI